MPFLPPNQEQFTQLAVITLVETTDGEMGCDGFSSAKRENLATSRKATKLSKQSFHVVAPVVWNCLPEQLHLPVPTDGVSVAWTLPLPAGLMPREKLASKSIVITRN